MLTKLILPKHVTELELHNIDLKMFEKRCSLPILDGEEVHKIEQALIWSCTEQRLIKLKLWGDPEELEIAGVAKSIHTYSREIKFEIADATQWIKINQIV